ncbi:hypothetical protein TREES_T100016009 [Tupaia chinensis]|uniref:Uncharacterized protein n=1 Tax=Tupaia chinensis TaxID=246437 RepID=L9KKH1_TUPCH|nr:hypothetical protein TREES_T100016009 [Tupaia chinensis]
MQLSCGGATCFWVHTQLKEARTEYEDTCRVLQRRVRRGVSAGACPQLPKQSSPGAHAPRGSCRPPPRPPPRGPTDAGILGSENAGSRSTPQLCAVHSAHRSPNRYTTGRAAGPAIQRRRSVLTVADCGDQALRPGLPRRLGVTRAGARLLSVLSRAGQSGQRLRQGHRRRPGNVTAVTAGEMRAGEKAHAHARLCVLGHSLIWPCEEVTWAAVTVRVTSRVSTRCGPFLTPSLVSVYPCTRRGPFLTPSLVSVYPCTRRSPFLTPSWVSVYPCTRRGPFLTPSHVVKH